MLGQLQLHPCLEPQAHETLGTLLLQTHHVGPPPQQTGGLEVGDERTELGVVGEDRPDPLRVNVQTQLHRQPAAAPRQSLHGLLDRVQGTDRSAGTLDLKVLEKTSGGGRKLRQGLMALATDSMAKPSPDQAEAVLDCIAILQLATAGPQAGRCETKTCQALWGSL